MSATLTLPLLLSLSHPVTLPVPATQTWVSDPAIAEAVVLNGRRLVLRGKREGSAFLAADGEPRKILVLSEANYAAHLRCPSAPLEWTASPPVARGLDPTTSPNLSRCGFDRVGVSVEARENFEKAFSQLENTLVRESLLEAAPEWAASGQRKLLVSSGRRAEIQRRLGERAPFYAIEESTSAQPGRTLVFEVTLFEFSRKRALALGLKWPSSARFRPAGSGLGAWSFDAAASDMIFGADFGESLGIGKVLSRPQIRTKPGEKASFQSGGEIPVKSVSQNFAETKWKSYGLLLTLEPDGKVLTGAREIALSLKIELSEPDPSMAIDGVPGMLVRKLESRFDLRTSETTVLTTLTQSRSSDGRAGLPGLSRVPVLKGLFSSSAESEQDSELWIAVKPRWESGGLL